jgi:hypothetical protein
VHEVEIEVVDTEVLQGGIECGLDIIGVVLVVPELSSRVRFGFLAFSKTTYLCRDENLFSRNTTLFDCLADIRFGSVDPCCIYVSVSGFQSCQCGIILRVFILPRPESDRGDLSSGVEPEMCL